MKSTWKVIVPALAFFVLGLGLLFYLFFFDSAINSSTSTEKIVQVGKQEAAQARAVFSNIPKKGASLGNEQSKETITIFADLQCKFCSRFFQEGIHVLLKEVRRGDLRLDLRTITPLGSDSTRAAEAIQALSSQNKMWEFAELFYLNQGKMKSGYVTDAFIQELYTALGVNKEMVRASREKAKERVVEDNTLAAQYGPQGGACLVFLSKDGTTRPLMLTKSQDFSKEGMTKALAKARGN